jgi:hypothetical protein
MPQDTLQPTTLRQAFSMIEDELTELNAATGVLHLAFHDMTADGQDDSALAQSIFFTARSIEALVKRIEAKLLGEERDATPYACSREEVRQ